MRLVHDRSGLVLATRVERATTFGQRLVGLLGRSALPPGAALSLEPCSSVHTFFLRFPIDVLFLDRGGVVLRAVDALAPWRATLPCRGASRTIELPAGTLGAAGIVAGDRVSFVEPDAA